MPRSGLREPTQEHSGAVTANLVRKLDGADALGRALINKRLVARADNAIREMTHSADVKYRNNLSAKQKLNSF